MHDTTPQVEPRQPEPVPEPAPHPRRDRLVGLDALRGVAATSVMVFHLTTEFHRNFTAFDAAPVEWPYGYFGVQLFFLISGFVILMSVDGAGRPADFVVSRFARLYPTYAAGVLLTLTARHFCLISTAPGGAALVSWALWNLTMVQGLFGISAADPVYWTLQVELIFYLVVLVLLALRATRWAVPVMTAFVAAAVADHLFLPRPVPWWHYVLRFYFLDYVYLFTAGVVFYRSLRDGWRWWYAGVLLLCLASPWTQWPTPAKPVLDTAVSAALAGVVYLASRGRLDFLANRALLFLGTISYPLYLTHYQIGCVLLIELMSLGAPPLAALGLAVALCLGLAALLTFKVERPAMAAIRRAYRRATATAAAAKQPAAAR